MLLSNLAIGQTAKISGFNLNPTILLRLKRMGITVGVKITLVRRAPLLDPIEFKVRGFYLALRKTEADNIFVQWGK